MSDGYRIGAGLALPGCASSWLFRPKRP